MSGAIKTEKVVSSTNPARSRPAPPKEIRRRAIVSQSARHFGRRRSTAVIARSEIGAASSGEIQVEIRREASLQSFPDPGSGKIT
jgi:hypothetical protein